MIMDCASTRTAAGLTKAGCRSRKWRPGAPTAASSWLGLFEPDKAELDQVREVFGLHELAVEDALSEHMRPKIERYDGDVQLVILRTARYDDDAEESSSARSASSSRRPSSLPYGKAWPASCAVPGSGWSSALTAGVRQLGGPVGDPGPVVDGYAPVVAELERDIDQIEATVFSGAAAPTERIYSLRREATDFYRAVHPLLPVIASVERMATRSCGTTCATCKTTCCSPTRRSPPSVTRSARYFEANMAVISVEQTRSASGRTPPSSSSPSWPRSSCR